ncbi:hypothetical protein BG011_007288 [Mortierella polycephala]|uniref:Uncharacterized protein n=1 Tax=Mortierella polycephala TaxID=41804 RepID=A0A9P6PSE1_9FUNG|nr:hypothetical protein BG011_007288 [Mortierella polycephala]
MRQPVVALWYSIIFLSSLCVLCSTCIDAEHSYTNKHAPQRYDAHRSIHKRRQSKDQEPDLFRLSWKKNHSPKHEAQPKNKYEEHHHSSSSISSKKALGQNAFHMSTFHKKGKVYIVAHQDWYNQYRRQRGPNAVMRKLSLASARRRKAMLTFIPTEAGGKLNVNGSFGSIVKEFGDPNMLQGTGSRSKTDVRVGVGADVGTRIGADTARPGKVSMMPDPELESFGSSNGKEVGKKEDEEGRDAKSQGENMDLPTESIQEIKKPKFVGIPRPVSVRHNGLIPKARSDAEGKAQECVWSRSVVLTVTIVVLFMNK